MPRRPFVRKCWMARKLHLDPLVWIGLALGILLLPLNWLLAVGFAGAFHELCHMAAAKLLGVRILGLSVSTGGCLLETEPMENWKELLCALAGPLGSLSLILMARYFPRLAICGGIQGLFNLLPLYPLDGGRVLRCAAGMLLGQQLSHRILRWAEAILAAMLLAAAILLSFRADWGFLSIATGVLLAARLGKAKNSLQTGATRGTIELPFLKR